jgi:hypothetical protein
LWFSVLDSACAEFPFALLLLLLPLLLLLLLPGTGRTLS